ncbi:MAG: transposase [Rhodospirillaceae bacterium]
MARLPRYFAGGVAQHIIQRGSNRQACFFAPQDFIEYRDVLCALSGECGVAVHAYVLMTNHVHLLATPSASGGLSKLMQRLGVRYAGYVNHRYDRTGPLFDGRYRATVVETETYLLRLMRYVELNPVRAGMVPAPAHYRWSSYGANAHGAPDPLVSPHALYQSLGADAPRRREAYRALFSEVLTPAMLSDIRAASHRGWALGNDRFRAEIAQACGRRAAPQSRGQYYT